MIAALYVALTYVSNSLGLAYNAIQFRLSEILTVLPVFTPAAIPGLVIGCTIANLSSPFGIIDIVCGSFATLVAAFVSYWLRNVKIKDIPFLSEAAPVIANGLIIGLEIWYLGDKTAELFFISALEVAIGEVVMCMVVGTIFLKAVQRTRLFDRINRF